MAAPSGPASRPDEPKLDAVAVSNAKANTIFVMDSINKVAEKVVQECQDRHNVRVSQLVAAFLVRASALKTGLTEFETPLSAADTAELVKMTVATILDTGRRSLDTVKMQLAFHSTYASEEAKLYQVNARRQEDNQAKLDEIIETSKNLQDEAQVTKLYRQIFQFLLANGCVSLVNRNVEREIAAALESVFPKFGLKTFSAMSLEDRRAQVRDLLHIVLGIRLFNKDIGKGGAGLVEAYEEASREVTELCNDIEKEIQGLLQTIGKYVLVIDAEHRVAGTISSSWEKLQEELTHRRQLVAYLKQLHSEGLGVRQIVDTTQSSFIEQLSKLKQLVGDKASVPKEDVYPKFDAIARLFMGLVAEKSRNAIRRAVFVELLKHKDAFTSSLTKEDVDVAMNMPPPADAKHADVSTIPLADEKNVDDNVCVRLTEATTPNFLSMPVEYQGYCPYTLITRGGLVLSGNPSLGLLRFRGKYYSLADEQAMLEFSKDTERCIARVTDTVRKRPELIHLLRLQDQFKHVACSLFVAEGKRSVTQDSTAIMVDQSDQTPVHFVESHIDPTYQWNEWELRKKAIQLTNLRHKATHGCQTDNSHFRRDNETQVYLPKILSDGSAAGKGTQTGINASTNTPVVKKFITGLRGDKDQTKLTVVTLTLEQEAPKDPRAGKKISQ